MLKNQMGGPFNRYLKKTALLLQNVEAVAMRQMPFPGIMITPDYSESAGGPGSRRAP